MSTVFEALADPTRRQILDRLRHTGPLSVTELAEPLDMTRQATTKHLDLLSDSGLIRVRWQGRRRLHVLDPDPLAAVRDWLAPFAAEWDDRLERLRRHVDRDAADPATDPSPR